MDVVRECHGDTLTSERTYLEGGKKQKKKMGIAKQIDRNIATTFSEIRAGTVVETTQEKRKKKNIRGMRKVCNDFARNDKIIRNRNVRTSLAIRKVFTDFSVIKRFVD